MHLGESFIFLASCNLICLWTLASCLRVDTDASSGGLDVRVKVSVVEHLVTLSCDVTGIQAGADDHKVQFFCPVLSGGVQCYGDCSPICTMQGDGSCLVMDPILESASVACEKVVSPPDAKTVRLLIDTRQRQLAGQWRCKFRGTSSATVDLTQYHAPPTEKPPRVATRGGHAHLAYTGAPPPQPNSVTAAPPDWNGLGVWKPDSNKFSVDFAPTQGFERDPNLVRFARTDYVIGVLTIMSVSLLLNLGFCIRCILARHYVDTRRRKRKPLGWLSNCLCVSSVQVLEEESQPEGDPRERLARMHGQRRTTAAHPQQQRQPHCLYCMQADCRILYDDVAGQSESGSACRVRSSFRSVVPAVPEEAALFADGGEGRPGSLAEEQEDDTESDFSGPSSRLELSRKMLRKADTLLREANSLLLETEPTTEQQEQQ